MADKAYTDEQRRKFAEATGLEADKVTDEMLTAAGVTAEPEKPAVDEPKVELEDADKGTLAAALKLAASADERTRKLEDDLKSERARNFVELALREGKVTPGQRETLQALYETNPDIARAFVAEASPNEDLAREYGSDDETEAVVAQRELEEKTFEADTAARLGIPAGELI